MTASDNRPLPFQATPETVVAPVERLRKERFAVRPARRLGVLLLATACANGAVEAPGEPWSLATVRPDASDGVHILVVHDMEGLSGQTDPATYVFGRPEYAEGQRLLAADVNAVVAGLYEGGATEVHVVDGHGSGNPAPDLRSDLLDARAEQVIRDAPFDAYVDLVERGGYDAVAVVGMHAKTGSGGYAAHTYTLGIDFLINGRSITETELLGLSFGRADIPVIFASGDDRLRTNLETMPWLEYVTVKTAVHPDSAVLRPVEEARADLTAGAARAVRKLQAGDAMAMHVSNPISTALATRPPANVAVLEGVPGIELVDNRVAFTADSMRDAYDGLVALVHVSTLWYAGLLFEMVREHPDGEQIMDAHGRALDRRWFEVESGQWTEPDEAPPAGLKFHGYR